MSHDPILDSIDVIAHRALVFVLLSVFQAILLFWWFLTCVNGIEYTDLIPWLDEDGVPGRSLITIFWYFLIVGVFNTSVVYLTIGVWWKRRADVHHYRGAHLERNGD